jgi:hypothetical protein
VSLVAVLTARHGLCMRLEHQGSWTRPAQEPQLYTISLYQGINSSGPPHITPHLRQWSVAPDYEQSGWWYHMSTLQAKNDAGLISGASDQCDRRVACQSSLEAVLIESSGQLWIVETTVCSYELHACQFPTTANPVRLVLSSATRAEISNLLLLFRHQSERRLRRRREASA